MNDNELEPNECVHSFIRVETVKMDPREIYSWYAKAAAAQLWLQLFWRDFRSGKSSIEILVYIQRDHAPATQVLNACKIRVKANLVCFAK